MNAIPPTVAYLDVVAAAAASEPDYPWPSTDVQELATAGLSGAADRLAFAIITPDTLHRGRLGAVLDDLVGRGAVILAARVRTVTDEDVEELYKAGLRRKIFAAQETHWYLTRQGLRSGASVGLLLGSTRPGLCADLREWKGASDPFGQDESSIRAGHGAMSKILSVMHSSDGPAEVFREALLYFSADEVRGALHTVRALAAGEPVRAVTTRETVEAAATTLVDDDPLTILACVLARATAALTDGRAPVDEQLHRTLRAAHHDLTDLVPTTRSSKRWTHEVDQVTGVLHSVADGLRGPESVRAVQRFLADGLADGDLNAIVVADAVLAVRALADVDGYRELDVPSSLGAVAAVGVYVTGWEGLVLTHACRFWPQRA